MKTEKYFHLQPADALQHGVVGVVDLEQVGQLGLQYSHLDSLRLILHLKYNV